MLPKNKRLLKKDHEGLSPRIFFRSPLLDILYSPKNETKFACVISKKQIARAVDRNKVRRRVYSILQETKPKNIGFFVVYPKKVVLQKEREDIKREMEFGFATLG